MHIIHTHAEQRKRKSLSLGRTDTQRLNLFELLKGAARASPAETDSKDKAGRSNNALSARKEYD